jgi:hypothetical protein
MQISLELGKKLGSLHETAVRLSVAGDITSPLKCPFEWSGIRRAEEV